MRGNGLRSVARRRPRSRSGGLEPTPPGPGLAVGRVRVPVKSAGQQAVLMLHRTRVLLIRQTMLANAFRAHLAEFGIVVVQGIRHVRELIERVFAEDIFDLPALVRTALRPLVAQLMELRLRSKRNSLPGIGQARKAGGWKRSPEWGLLRRRWNRLSSERINQEM